MLGSIFLISCSFLTVLGGNNYDIITYHESDEPSSIFRLPATVVPNHYKLWIATNIHRGDFTFNGKVIIDLTVEIVSKEIILHGKQFNILNTRLWNNANAEVPVDISSTILDENTQLITVTTVEDLAMGEYSLEIEYQGTLRDDELGFFRTSYIGLSNSSIWIAATRFKAMEARHAFPCFDEPALKATFGITIEHGCSFDALSNNPGQKTNIAGDDMCSTTFEITPRMSTYTVAFTITDFTSITSIEVPAPVPRHTLFGALIRINLGGTFALEASEKILPEFESYTGHNFDLAKLDQIALPNFRQSGAIENWGLITYDELNIYTIPIVGAFDQEERVVTMIAHQFAHQWFGNLVTMEWWEYLWLNEGFAFLFENLITDRLWPGVYNRMDVFVVNILQIIMQEDADENVRPINYNPTDQNKIMDIFDGIPYEKGASVIRMIMHAITEPIFQKGLQYYINDNQFSSVNPQDLYRSLQLAIDEHPGTIPEGTAIATIFDSWTSQSGFPVLNVNYDLNTHEITLTQKRYLRNSEEEAEVKTIWWIPYNFMTHRERFNNVIRQSTIPDGWLNESTTVITPDSARNWTGDPWIIFNKQQTGYYRVNYNLELWNALILQLHREPPQISRSRRQIFPHFPIDHIQRAQLIDDSLDLARTGRLPYGVSLQLLSYIRIFEDHYYGWESAVNGINRLDRAVFGAPFYGRFLLYVQAITAPKFVELGIAELPSDEYHENYIRRNLIDLACKAQLPECLRTTGTKLLEIVQNLNETTEIPVSTFLATTIFRNGLRSLFDVDFFWQILDILAQSPSIVRNELISAIAYVHDAEMRKLFLSTVLQIPGETINDLDFNYSEEDRVNILVSIAVVSPSGYNAVVEFLKENYIMLRLLITTETHLKTIIGTVAELTVLKENLEMLTELITMFTTLSIERELAEHKALAERNVRWLDKYGASIDEWLIANEYTEDEDDGAATLSISVTFVLLTSMTIIWLSV